MLKELESRMLLTAIRKDMQGHAGNYGYGKKQKQKLADIRDKDHLN